MSRLKYVTRRGVYSLLALALLLLALAALPVSGAATLYILLAPSDFWQRVVTYALCAFVALAILVVEIFVVGGILQ